MKTYSAVDPNLGPVTYRDRKRYLWLGSVFYPLLPFSGLIPHYLTANGWWLVLPIVIAYVVGPLLDLIGGEDRNNPPEALVPQLEQDRYYRLLTCFTVPIHFISLLAVAWYVAAQPTGPLGIAEFVCLAFVAGITSGLGLNTAHELGHKPTRYEQLLARLALAVPVYGHFCVEHNNGHHRHVATPEDCASARMGESIYKFSRREIPGGFKRGWQLEAQRLERQGKKTWSRHNQILQSYAVSLVLQLSLVITLGWLMLPFLLLHNVFAWWQLTSANYIEHYGLLREKKANGRYERCQPHHSWNSNHIYSNLLLFQLERHSDHHANPRRRYQSLRNFDDVPRLPNGYMGMYLVAYVPWLWFHVMDTRLLSLKTVDGNLQKVNIDPHKRAQIFARYNQKDTAAC